MYVLIAGGGKAGANVMRTLLRNGHEATIIEQDRDRYERLESEFEHQAMNGDATELFVLEKAGIKRPPDLVLALTGDDEDNLVISQISKEKYAVPKVIARVNDPRNQGAGKVSFREMWSLRAGTVNSRRRPPSQWTPRVWWCSQQFVWPRVQE